MKSTHTATGAWRRFRVWASASCSASLGAVICFRAALNIDQPNIPKAYAMWALVVSMAAKAALSTTKFHFGRKIKSEALMADGWNDTVDILSAFAALVAVGLAVWQPDRFGVADHYGAFAVGLIVVFLGIRVVYETTQQLMDRMPSRESVEEIRRVAVSVPGALNVEKCFARKTGLRYHVDLHLEVDPDMTVRKSHEIAHEVRDRIKAELEWVADVAGSRRAALAGYNRIWASMENRELAILLSETADLMEIAAEDSFRIRSYRNAAAVIESYPERVMDIVADPERKVTDISGSGRESPPFWKKWRSAAASNGATNCLRNTRSARWNC